MEHSRLRTAFLGGIYPDDTSLLQSRAKVSLDYAADAYQKKYLRAFGELGWGMKIFSAPFLGSWPLNHKDLFLRVTGESSFSDVEYVNFFNPLFLRDRSRQRRIKKRVLAWVKSLKAGETPLLFCYSAGFSREILTLKKACPALKICIILPDLPAFTYLSDSSRLRGYLRKRREKEFLASCAKADGCICITQRMKEWVEQRTPLKCCVIEGFADRERCESSLRRLEKSQEREEKTVVYTGTLAKKYGILDLARAFCALEDKEATLCICGGGDAESELRELMQKDARIRFLGVVKNERAKELQENATVLVNPRSGQDEYTAYSFPSKTMEYLETGNAVVCHRLEGIPADYEGHILYAEEEGVEALRAALERALALSCEQRLRMGKENLEFLLKEKGAAALEAAVKSFAW